MLALVVTMAASCRKDPQQAQREELEETGYELTMEDWFRAAASDDVGALERLLDGGMALDTSDGGGATALHAAAVAGAEGSADFLLDRGLGVDVVDARGRTPLMEAVIHSTPGMVRYLLRQGADPSLKDGDQYKPLMLAVREGRAEMVAELAHYVRGDLDDALLAAAILGRAEVIDELTNFGASIYARLGDGRSPLMLAAQKGNAEAVELLLAIGANRFAMDEQGRIAADLAREGGHEDLAMRLAAVPEEGDFELEAPAELGAELVARVDEAAPGRGAGVPVEPGAEGPDGGGEVAEEPVALPLEGATLAAVAEPGAEETGEGLAAESGGGSGGNAATAGAGGGRGVAALGAEEALPPLVMRGYEQKELPVRIGEVRERRVEVRVPGHEPTEIGAGERIPRSSLKVIRVSRRPIDGKLVRGQPAMVSVVEVKDERSGVTRELFSGVPALAHDPVALVEDTATGRYYLARTGQRFRGASGGDFLVGDVRPSQVVIEDLDSGETMTVELRGPRG